MKSDTSGLTFATGILPLFKLGAEKLPASQWQLYGEREPRPSGETVAQMKNSDINTYPSHTEHILVERSIKVCAQVSFVPCGLFLQQKKGTDIFSNQQTHPTSSNIIHLGLAPGTRPVLPKERR